MGKIEKATQWMIDLANNPKHGYDQDNRWGPDYDCSSAVISAWQAAGVPVKSKGANTTHDMKPVFLSCGFKDVRSSIKSNSSTGLKRGDVLLNTESHTAMYIGNNQLVLAKMNPAIIMVENLEIRLAKKFIFVIIMIFRGIVFFVI